MSITAGGDLIESLPIDDSNPTQSEIAIMDKIFKKKKKAVVEKQTTDTKGDKKNNIIPVLIGGVISALLSLPFFSKLLKSCGVDNLIITIIAHFIAFVLIYFLVLKTMQKE